MRDNFRIDGSLSNSPSNDLGVLRAETKNQNSFGAILGGTGTLCLQEHYFTDSAKIVKRDRPICSQSLIASGGWDSLAYFGEFTPTLSGPVPTPVGASIAS